PEVGNALITRSANPGPGPIASVARVNRSSVVSSSPGSVIGATPFSQSGTSANEPLFDGSLAHLEQRRGFFCGQAFHCREHEGGALFVGQRRQEVVELRQRDARFRRSLSVVGDVARRVG